MLGITCEEPAREIVGVEAEPFANGGERERHVVVVAIADPAYRVRGACRAATSELQDGVEEDRGEETPLGEIRRACGDGVEEIRVDQRN